MREAWYVVEVYSLMCPLGIDYVDPFRSYYERNKH